MNICDHILGLWQGTYIDDYGAELIFKSDEMPPKKEMTMFRFCPECGQCLAQELPK